MTQEQRHAQFEAHGYVILEGLLSDAELEQSRREIRRLHEVAADLYKREDPAKRHFQREPFARDASTDDGLPVLRKIESTDSFSPWFTDVASHPGLVPVLREMLGDDLLLFRSTLMLKPAHHGSVHALHQDSAYWPMDPPTQVTVSIALTDATPDNGCFQVIPGSHKWPLQEWGTIAKEQGGTLSNRADLQADGLIHVPLKAGSALLFHSMLVHGSGPNRTANARNTALYAYFPPTVRYVPTAGQPREATYRVIHGMQGRQTHTFVADPVAV